MLYFTTVYTMYVVIICIEWTSSTQLFKPSHTVGEVKKSWIGVKVYKTLEKG